MVNLLNRRLMQSLVAGIFFLAGLAHGEDSLKASVDRTTLYSNEALQLEVQAQTKLELNLGTFFNLAGVDVPMPDLTPLEEDFRVLNRNQHMSVRSVNGDHSAHITWTYLLAPKRSGELVIPELTFEDKTSEAIEIIVYPGVSPDTAQDETSTRMELELSDNEVYVQQHLTLTQRVYYQPPLLRGELPAPEIENAIVERVGEQEEYTEEENGREWQVVERTYLVVPQSTGQLIIPPQEFQGRKRDAQGAIAFMRASSPELQVTVNPPPAEFTGDVWLPASSLDVQEEWSSDPETMEAGESINRKVTVRALGVLPEAFPNLEIDYPDTIREYPDPLTTSSRFTEDKLEATAQKSAALVPLEAGTTHLPELRIPWWDVINDRERVAVIPSREIVIGPAAGFNGVGADGDTGNGLPSTATRSPGTVLPDFWVWLAAILATGWLLTGIAWWRNRRRAKRSQESKLTPRQRAQRERFQMLCLAAEEGRAETLSLLPQWAAEHFGNPGLRTVSEVTTFANDPTLTREVEALQRHLFAPQSARGIWEGNELLAALRRIAGQPRRKTDRRTRTG